MKFPFLKKYVFVAFLLVLSITGCISFTQKDYDLQENAYKKEREAREQQQKDQFGWRW